MLWSISSGGRVMRAACWCCSEDMVVWRSDSILPNIECVIDWGDTDSKNERWWFCPINRFYVLRASVLWRGAAP
jgi:hypothetical protein